MLDRFGTAAPIVYLVALGIASVLLADSAWKSVTRYQTPYAYDEEFSAGETLTKKLVVIVLDGLRVDRARELENFQKLAARGSSGSVRVGMPSLSNPARATMATGAWPEVSGVTNNSRFGPQPMQSIFSLAKKHGLTITVFGSSFWRRAFGESLGDGYEHFEKELHGGHSPDELSTWQGGICDGVLAFLAEKPAAVTVVGLTAGDEAGHDFGGDSDGYRVVTAAVDNCLGRIVSHFDQAATTFVAVSDHGHINRRGHGGHGGAEPEVVNAPIALAGVGVRAGVEIDHELVDVAPTISALLGLPIPANSQGRVLTAALDASPEILTGITQRQRAQRESLARRLPDRDAGMAAERRDRALVAAPAALWFLLVLGSALIGASPARISIAIAVYFAVYYALFMALGLGYSLSAIIREEYLNGFFVKNILSAGSGYAVGLIWLTKSAPGATRPYLRLALAITSLIGLFVTWTYLQYGLLMRGFMLDLGPSFRAYLDLLSIFGIAIATVLAYLVSRRVDRVKAN